MIDTLQITENLHKAGLPTKQSSAIAKEIFRNNELQIEKLATKEQLTLIHQQLSSKFEILNMKMNLIMTGIGIMLALPWINSWVTEGLKLLSK